jgi:hypothetical protein
MSDQNAAPVVTSTTTPTTPTPAPAAPEAVPVAAATEVKVEKEAKADKPKAVKPKAEKRPNLPRRKDEDYFIAKQKERLGKSNIVPDTLLFVDVKDQKKTIKGHKVCPSVYEEHPNKQVILINTVGKDGKPDGGTRWVATSDLHHTIHSVEVTNELRLERIRERRKSKKSKKK